LCLLSGWLSRRLSSPRCLPSTGASASCRAPLVPLRITAIVIVIVVVVVVVIVVIVFIVVDNLPDQREQPSTLLLLLPFRFIVVSVVVAASRWEGGINSLIPSRRRGIEKGGAPLRHCCNSDRNNRDHNRCPSHSVRRDHCNLRRPIVLGWSLPIKNRRPNFSNVDAREMIRHNPRKGNASSHMLRTVDSQ
jgi:hypothetical protein